MRNKTIEINIIGIVQGVGFRPLLFNLARELNLMGFIQNNGNLGVKLVLQGKHQSLNEFFKLLKERKPEISYIEKIIQNELDTDIIYNDLKIKESQKKSGLSLTLPPDISICRKCLEEIQNNKFERYYNYPFIACSKCGPRYSTVIELPYDRERTTMNYFPFCNSCYREYKDPNNRRFHAQTFACKICGPNYKLYNDEFEIIQESSIEKILYETAKRLKLGQIGAIKGIGGVHLIALANNDEIVTKLRKRKVKRKNKPFALMIPDINIIDEDFIVSQKEKEIIESFRRPIVLLKNKQNISHHNISEKVAPGLNNIGFMLPYMGIHYLLFNFIGRIPIIYTSGNPTDIPMGINNEDIFGQLHGIADFFLLHNRDINQRIDDSVLRIHNNKVKLIRRSRGYVPEYITMPFKSNITGALATGPELGVSGAILRLNRIFPTQYIGNIKNLETFNFLEESLFHMKKLLQIKDKELKFIVSDAHPNFITTNYAQKLSDQFSIPLYKIQHHYAHILSLMIENRINCNERIIGISTDGIGYGDDGNIWGGEILSCTYNDYIRLGHLEYQPMIGGDRCTKFPGRMAASIILKNYEITDAKRIFKKINLAKDLEYKETELNTLISQFEKEDFSFSKKHIPLTSSTGRIFDTVSYLLGACFIKTYRGEPAMRLESLASKGNPKNIDLSISYENKNKLTIINTSQLIADIISLVENNIGRKKDIAAKFQTTLADIFAEIAINKAEKLNIKKVGLSGGVAYNYNFNQVLKKRISDAGLEYLEHNIIPPGDGGISIGQLVGGLAKHLDKGSKDN
ncbi:MAG: carbamoyltransferase HypF [Candidatus Lokiarchaeota archaeon]|nr:carbamoyltransferase HypF [Candidatus Lokiarchaeota archaeon]